MSLVNAKKFIIASNTVEQLAVGKKLHFVAIVFLRNGSEARACARARKMFKDLRSVELKAFEYESKEGQEIFLRGLKDASRIDGVKYTVESELIRYAEFDAIARKKAKARRDRVKAQALKTGTDSAVAVPVKRGRPSKKQAIADAAEFLAAKAEKIETEAPKAEPKAQPAIDDRALLERIKKLLGI